VTAVEDLESWVDALCSALAVDRAAVDVPAILDLARDAAHGVARPAAPVSAFIAGLAAAGGAAPDRAIAAAAQLARDWPAAS